MIHPTAVIDSRAYIASDVSIGAYCVVEGNVRIDSGCQLHSHVIIRSGCRIGKGNEFFQFCSISEQPQLPQVGGMTASFAGMAQEVDGMALEIGDGNIFREWSSVHRGTSKERATSIGSENFMLAYTHLGYGTKIGDCNVLSNGAQFAELVVMDNHCTIGGGALIGPSCRIGSYAMIGGGCIIEKDVPAFSLISGDSATARSVNQIGLRRHGFDPKVVANIRKAFRIFYLQANSIPQALVLIQEQCNPSAELDFFVASLSSSDRPVVRYARS